MPQDFGPKVILNEDYLDLRSQKHIINSISDRKSIRSRSTSVRSRRQQSTETPRRVVDLNSEGLRYEKELINCGLKKLATSYNATAQIYQRQNSISSSKKKKLRDKSLTDPRFRNIVVVPQEKIQLKSQSTFSLASRSAVPMVQCRNPNSSPILQHKISQFDNKPDAVFNKYTMTKPDDVIERAVKCPKSLRTARSRSNEFRKTPNPRLCEKYSVLKLPWQRSWTLPTFAARSSLDAKCDLHDNSDRQTYLYDDGTEIDSLYLEEKKITIANKTVQKQCLMILFLCGSICGILLVSALIWLIFGNNFFGAFLKPRKVQEGGFKKSFKYLGGGLIYVITRIFESLGYVLALPTQKIYQSEPEYYRWPINPTQ